MPNSSIAVFAATKFEIAPLIKYIKSNKQLFKHLSIEFYITGVSSSITTFFICQALQKHSYNFIIQVGIAGAFDKDLQLGNAVVVQKEYFADIGVLEKSEWIDVFSMGFIKPNSKPFSEKALVNKWCKKIKVNDITFVNGVTVNTISTNKILIKQFTNQYKAQIETMEGAAFHYVANSLQIPYVQIRGISNYVGERNKSKWTISQAIDSSNQLAIDLLLSL